jgi:two-component system OmpR family response regulator
VLDELRRNRPNLPVILLTALGELEDRITGLDAGATDYIVKPFSVAELAARIRAHLRAISDTPTTIHAGDLELDLIERRVRRSGRQVHLSSTEFQLLAYFVRNAGRVITRTQLLQAVWGYQHDPGTNTVEVYVGYLRRKLQLDGRELPLVTIRAVGYRLDAET